MSPEGARGPAGRAAIKMQEPDLKMFLYFSELQGRSVVDAEGRTVGKLADLKVRLGELFPKVTIGRSPEAARREARGPPLGPIVDSLDDSS